MSAASAGRGLSSVSSVAGVALADLRDRTRRPSYAVTLLATVALGWLAVPAAGSHWVILQIGDHRGTYNSAYVGLATALAGTLWLALGGFYVVRGVPARDESSGVGRLLAATPLRTTAYFAGKLLGNVLVLASMLGALAVTAPVMQLLRGESRAVDPVALLLPFAVLALPVMVAVAAAALLIDTVPGLRGGSATWSGSSSGWPSPSPGRARARRSAASACTRPPGPCGPICSPRRPARAAASASASPTPTRRCASSPGTASHRAAASCSAVPRSSRSRCSARCCRVCGSLVSTRRGPAPPRPYARLRRRRPPLRRGRRPCRARSLPPVPAGCSSRACTPPSCGS